MVMDDWCESIPGAKVRDSKREARSPVSRITESDEWYEVGLNELLRSTTKSTIIG
jgi:hypothetical protein